jgi:hypothetical protein
MIKTSFLIVILVVGCVQCYSQLYVGVQGGVGIASQSWTTNDANSKPDVSSLTGVMGGVMARYYLSKNIGVQGELSYIRKGAHTMSSIPSLVGGNIVTVESHTDSTFNFIEIPVMFCYTLPSVLPMLDVSILAGPSIGLYESGRTKGYISTSAGKVTGSVTDKVILKTDVRSPELSLTAGLSAGLNLSSSVMVSLTGRYLLGVSNLVPEEEKNAQSNMGIENVKNRSILIMAGVAVRL